MARDSLRQALPFAVLGGVMLWQAMRRFRTLRSIQDTARSRSASAPQGHVELQGVAWPDGESTIRSAGGAEVVYHALKLQREEWRGTGKSRRREWVTVLRREHAPPFFLVDATGLVRVHPSSADLDLATDRKRTWRSLNQDERQRVLEAAAGQSVSGFPPSEFLFGLFASKFRIVESEIRVGSPVYAHGDFRTEGGAPELVRARGLSQFHARFFDPAAREQKRMADLLGGDGDTEVSALETIEGLCRVAASDREQARETAAEPFEFPVHGRLTTSDQHKLFVADRHEEHLVQDIGRKVWLPFGGGLLALAVALVLWTVDFGGRFSSAAPTTTAPATSAPQAGVHQTLRGRCLGDESAACGELLRRAGELRITEGYRQEYARRACTLGLSQHCAATKAP